MPAAWRHDSSESGAVRGRRGAGGAPAARVLRFTGRGPGRCPHRCCAVVPVATAGVMSESENLKRHSGSYRVALQGGKDGALDPLE